MLKTIKNILNSQLYAISLYARSISGTVILFVIAHYLSVFDYGLFSSYKSIAIFLFYFANMGFADYILVSSNANIKEVKLKISLFMLNAVLLAFLFVVLSLPFKMYNHFLFILVIIRTFFDGTFFSLIFPYFQASKKFNTIAKINIFYSICLVIIAIISYIFKLSLVKFLILNIILGGINFLQCSYYAKINYLFPINYLKRFIKKLDKEIFSYIGAFLACLLYSQVSQLYVATVIPKEQAALYFAAYTIATVIMLLIQAQAQKMIPEMIGVNIDKVKDIIRKNLYFIISVTTFVFIFFLLTGKFILQLLYGQQYYTNAYPILLILMLGNIGVAEAGVFGTYITASGNQKMKIPMQLEATVITILGLIILHKYGIYGASISYLLAATYIAFRYTLKTKQLLINMKKV